MKPISLLVGIILSAVALVHLLRFVFQLEVTVGGAIIPVWMSGVACVAIGIVVILFFREQRR